MGAGPIKSTQNIYCRCRKEAAIYNDALNSREGAAEALGLSVSTLADYELGLTKIIPADSIMRMADLYNAPEIKNHYCRNCCPLGDSVPELELMSLDRIALKALSSLRTIQETNDKIIDIAADGIISEDEKIKLDSILANLDELEQITQSLKAWVQMNMRQEG